MTIENSGNSPFDRERVLSNTYISLVAGGGDTWQHYGDDAKDLYMDTFEPIVEQHHHVNIFSPESIHRFAYEEIEKRFKDTDTTLVVLQETSSDEFLGYTYAFTSGAELSSQYKVDEYMLLGMNIVQYAARQQKTAEVGHTILKPEQRGKGNWSRMMDTLEAQLLARNFDEMIRIVREEDNYADKLRQRYKGELLQICQIYQVMWGHGPISE